MSNVTVGSLIDHYKILEEIGRGGMGVVFKALNVNLDKVVAVKTIALGLASDEIFLNRFRTEARALARLQDPNIVSIYDLRLDDNQWFIVMEFVEGITLAKRIRQEKIITWQEALEIFKQMLSAIGHAHRLGVIHRDIKPNNVMITPEGIVKVTDFGLAKDQRNNNQTMVSSTGGTLYYMSPEQLRGLHYTDFRSDIYALGITFYEMLTGKIPFRKDDTDFTIREAIIRRQFPPPTQFNSEIPAELNDIVMRAIKKKPEDRFQSIDGIFEAIHEFEHTSGIVASVEDHQTETRDISAIPEPHNGISFFSNTTPQQVIPGIPLEKKRKFPAYSMAIIAFLVSIIALALVYFFPVDEKMAPVMIISQPPSALVYINDDSVGITPVFLEKVPQESYHVKLRKSDYVALDTIMSIKNDSLNHFAYTLIPFARLQINVAPESARVLLDEKLARYTQGDSLVIAPGKYNLSISHPGYVAHQQSLTLLPGINPDIAIVLKREDTNVTDGVVSEIAKKAPPVMSIPDKKIEHTQVVIASSPSGAAIWLNDQQLPEAETPYTIDSLTFGEQKLRLVKAGFRTYEQTFSAVPGPVSTLQADLIREEGTLNIMVKPYGSIYIDNELKKKDTNIKYSQKLPAGEHTVIVTHPLFGEYRKVIHVRDHQTIDIPVNFNDKVNVRITAFDAEGKPVWAEIVVDNKATGELTPKEIAVRVGQRTIAAKKDGYVLVNGEHSLMLDKNVNTPIKFIFKKVL